MTTQDKNKDKTGEDRTRQYNTANLTQRQGHDKDKDKTKAKIKTRQRQNTDDKDKGKAKTRQRRRQTMEACWAGPRPQSSPGPS